MGNFLTLYSFYSGIWTLFGELFFLFRVLNNDGLRSFAIHYMIVQSFIQLLDQEFQ
jgi:hypothetical protein